MSAIPATQVGDDAYQRLVEPHRVELHAHCYRMLGSVHDAEDALQDTLVRAWRGLAKFEGRSSVRTWLFKIATNACLDAAARRPKRIVPFDLSASAGPDDNPGAPRGEPWIGPYPDEILGLEDGRAAPEARYERRESVELAFIAALQHLPARQRAVLVLREVLGFSARETADSLDTTVVSVNSALQRARSTLDERLPKQSQQETLRTLGDARVRELVTAYADAMDRADLDAVLELLTEDATWTMPPSPAWYGGLTAVTGFLTNYALTVRWAHAPAHANGQPAVGCYRFDESRGVFVASVLDVLSFRDGRIAAVNAFVTSDAFEPGDAAGTYDTADLFGRFDLPLELPAG
jgi:RNA polymerase sigma-70 factor (ECF subfamily)